MSRALNPKIIAGVAAVSAGLIALPPMVAPVAHQPVQQRTVKLAAGIRVPNPDYYYYWDLPRVELDMAEMDLSVAETDISKELSLADADISKELSVTDAFASGIAIHVLTEEEILAFELQCALNGIYPCVIPEFGSAPADVAAAHAAVPLDAAAEPAKSSVDLAAAHAAAPADLSAAAADIGVALTHIVTESPTILLGLLP